MKLSIVGAGYVGLVTGVGLADLGNNVTCIDIDKKKVKMLSEAKSPIYEEGLGLLLKKVIQKKKINFSSEYSSVANSEIVFLAVGTPQREDGSTNLDYLFSALYSISDQLHEKSILIIKSTVPVGTAQKINQYLENKLDFSVSVVSNPEFLKEGCALKDFFNPERIVLGASSDSVYPVLEELYEAFFRKGVPLLKMDNQSAELSKYAANAFLATKITFMNELTALCEKKEASIDFVKDVLASDTRIGSKFLSCGPGYGGSCFPKDLRGLSSMAKEEGLCLGIVEKVDQVNLEHQKRCLNLIVKDQKRYGKAQRVSLLGLAFKAGTDDVRKSPSLYFLEELVKNNIQCKVYDPVAIDSAKKALSQNALKALRDGRLQFCTSIDGALTESTGTVLMTDWDEIVNVSELILKKEILANAAIYDLRNIWKNKKWLQRKYRYFSLGSGWSAFGAHDKSVESSFPQVDLSKAS